MRKVIIFCKVYTMYLAALVVLVLIAIAFPVIVRKKISSRLDSADALVGSATRDLTDAIAEFDRVTSTYDHIDTAAVCYRAGVADYAERMAALSARTATLRALLASCMSMRCLRKVSDELTTHEHGIAKETDVLRAYLAASPIRNTI